MKHAPDDYQCPFCLVARNERNEHVLTTPSDVIFRDECLMAFISAHQWENNKGHVLVIPNQHFENLYELPDDVGGKIHAFSRRIALAMKAVYTCDSVSTRQHNEPAGNQDVWHYHLHVFPRYEQDNLYTTTYALLPARDRAEYATRLRHGLDDIIGA